MMIKIQCIIDLLKHEHDDLSSINLSKLDAYFKQYCYCVGRDGP